jgi:hypothetical protein
MVPNACSSATNVSMHRSRRVVVAVSVLLAAALSTATSVAAGALPTSWRPHLWLAWPVSMVLAVTYAAVEIRRASAEPAVSALAAAGRSNARARLLERVERIWVISVLERSLYQEARLELGLMRSVDAPHPWDIVSGRQGSGPELLPSGTSLGAVFDELDKAVLIMGPPGSGKTTTILELLRELLGRARADSDVPIPVLLPLASWALSQGTLAGSRETLAGWMLREVSERYQVAVQHVRAWLDGEILLPLLDGLDEVAVEHREECIKAINLFRHEHGTVPIAVCCRTGDYQLFQTRLELYGTLTIEPLSRQQVERFLDRPDRKFAGAQAALAREPALWALADTPLILSIMVLAFRDPESSESLGGITRQELRDHLFATYVRTMLTRRRAADHQPSSTIRRLAFVACQLERWNQTLFSTDLLGRESLPDGWWSGALWGIGCAVWEVVSTVAMSAVGIVFYGWPRGATAGVIVGLLSGLPVRPTQIFRRRYWRRPLQVVKWFLRDAWYARKAIVVVLVAGAATGIVLGGPGGIRWMATYAAAATIAGITATAMLPVQRIGSRFVEPRSYRTGDFPILIELGLLAAPAIGMLCGVMTALLVAWWTSVADGLRFGLATAVCLTLFVLGCLRGFALTQQTLIRLKLHRADLLPIPIRPFFDYAVQCLFLRRAGEGYLFVHRSMQEFFAALYPTEGRRNEPDAARVRELVPPAEQ